MWEAGRRNRTGEGNSQREALSCTSPLLPEGSEWVAASEAEDREKQDKKAAASLLGLFSRGKTKGLSALPRGRSGEKTSQSPSSSWPRKSPLAKSLCGFWSLNCLRMPAQGRQAPSMKPAPGNMLSLHKSQQGIVPFSGKHSGPCL